MTPLQEELSRCRTFGQKIVEGAHYCATCHRYKLMEALKACPHADVRALSIGLSARGKIESEPDPAKRKRLRETKL